ncbi:ankyrin repeat-containing domain protein [Mycena latifolia]|nr:ankyrin repeat-containing domain protein [Mycena latifolia]
MSDRRRDRLRNWVYKLLPSTSTSTQSNSAEAAIDNITVVLGLVQQVANVVERAPFLGPAAALMSEILKVYKEVKDTNEKRDALLANITDLTRDLCGTILRMEASNHLDLIGRLKADVEAYARLLAKASACITDYNNQGSISRAAARNELGTTFEALNRKLDSFGSRFRTNRLVDLAINQSMNARTLEEVHDIVLEEKLEKWLKSPPDMKQKQLDTQKLRKDRTGLWLLEGETFIEWQDNPGSLWIEDPSGSGKSVLSSTVISKLLVDKQLFMNLENSPDPPAIAFFYFDFKDNTGHAMEKALQRISLQLSAQSPNLYRVLDKQYRVSNGQTLPTFQDLLKVVTDLLLELGRTYIVLDALDECQESDLEQLLAFIDTLRGWTQTPLHLLVTSQPRNIFTEHFWDVTRIVLEADVTEKDIRLFVSAELQKPKLRVWASQADYITEKVVQKSNGMFRLAACLLVEITRRWQNPDGLNKILDNLPSDLFEIYNRFLEAIHPDDFVYVEGVLRWLAFSTHGLSLNELADAVAFDFSDPAQYIYDPSRREGNTVAILTWLEGLVIASGSTVTLAHASVQDYIMSRQFTHKFGPDLSASLSHTFIARTCIGYLLHFSDPSVDHTPRRWEYPLVSYAARNWCHHLLRCHDRNVLFPGAMRLLEDGSPQYSVLIWMKRNQDFRPTSPLHWCCQEGYIDGVRALLANTPDINLQLPSGTLLQVASEYGHMDITRLLLQNGADVNARGGLNGSPLRFASGTGQFNLVQLLLEHGADVNANCRHWGTALQSASSTGRTDIVHILLENGANIDAVGGEDGTALRVASLWGHIETAQLLLKNGADVDKESGSHNNPLRAASEAGCADIVRLLIDKGADLDATGGGCASALTITSGKGHTEIVHLLLEKGACVNMGWKHSDALSAASSEGHTESVHLLLEHGADVNATNERYGNSLHAAAASRCISNIDIVQVLLDNGADANATGGKYGSALQAACTTDKGVKVARILLNNGADLNARGGEYGSALVAASKWGNMNTVKLLLERGADVNATGSKYGSPLQAAASSYRPNGSIEIVWLLLENGADVNATGGEYESALQAAASKGSSDMVQLLLANGADPNTFGGHYGSALQAASSGINTNIMQLLLATGADVNAEGGYYGSALQAASANEWSRTEVVQLLLDNGANVDAKGGEYGSALQAAAASAKWSNEVVRLLLENGADVNAAGGKYGTSLQAACFSSRATDIVPLLLKHGADVNTMGGEYGSALQAASTKWSIDIIHLLLENGADVNAEGGKYGTPLQAACCEGNPDIVNILLQHGADVNRLGGKYGTALQAASAHERAEVVQLLLENGANVDAVGGECGSALQAACAKWRNNIIYLLLENGADVNTSGGKYGTPLQAASYNHRDDIVSLLLTHCADVNGMGGEYGSALQAACFKGDTEIGAILLDHGANVNTIGGAYGSPLQAAAIQGHVDVISLLVEHGADVNAIGGEYGTALQAACCEGRTYVVRLLLKHGADANAIGGAYGSALQAASHNGHTNIVEILLEKGAVDTRNTGSEDEPSSGPRDSE